MAQTSINIRMDEELKKSMEQTCQELGMNMTSGILCIKNHPKTNITKFQY